MNAKRGLIFIISLIISIGIGSFYFIKYPNKNITTPSGESHNEEAGIPLAGLDYGPFDKNGIPMDNYQGGTHCNPLVITYYAAGYLKEYRKTNDQIYLQAYNKMLDWLMESGEPFKNNSIVWFYDYDNPPYSDAPWYSGLTQGRVMRVFLGAYDFSGDQKYLDFAEKSLNGMLVPFTEGGVYYQDKYGDSWIMEVSGITPSFILNGNISSIVSLDAYYQKTKNEKIKKIINELIDSAARKLPLFDVPDKECSRYDLYGKDVIFDLSKKGSSQGPEIPLPIDELRLEMPADPPIIVDIGQTGDISEKDFGQNGKLISQSSLSEQYILDGRTVRNYKKKEGVGKGYLRAWMFPVGNATNEEMYKLTISYKDSSFEEFCLKIFYPLNKNGIEIGCFAGKNEGIWKTETFEFPQKTISSGLGRLECPGTGYHKMHLSQLEWLYDYSGKEIFRQYSDKWANYNGKN